MSNKKSNIENLTCEKVEVVNNDTVQYSHIVLAGSAEENTMTAKGTVDILVYDEKILGAEKSNTKLATYNFTAKLNIHDGDQFAGMLSVSRNLLHVYCVSPEATDVRLAATTLDLSYYQSVRLDEIIRHDVKSAFLNNSACEQQA